MAKRFLSLLVTSLMVGAGLVAGSAAAVASSHPAKPSSVSLSGSYSRVTSSTGQSLHVALTASNNPSTPANDVVTIDLASGPHGLGESHSWTFPISSSVLQVASSGVGTLKMPAKDLAPFGAVSLTFKPVSSVTSKSCQGKVISKALKVTLSGVFFFDSKSMGSHAWGTVGSKKSFHFASTNTVTWLFNSSTSQNCISTATPCVADVFWSAQQGGVNLDGVQAGAGATMTAGRSVSLSKPYGAKRSDSVVVPTKQLTLVPGAGGNASLKVTAGVGATGSATLSSDSPSLPSVTPCGKGKKLTNGFWLAGYVNGSAPLTVAAQIYGAITLANNDNATISQTTVS